MTANATVQVGLFAALLLAAVKPLGLFMARVYEGRIPRPLRFLGPLERFIHRAAGIDRDLEMTWRQYTTALLAFSLVGVLAVYGVQRFQGLLPLNPEEFPAVTPDSAFNTSVSFVTNTNWQGYSGESTMSYLTQAVALTVQNFASAAAGMAVLIALIRGFTRRQSPTIGNFWLDLT
jgi:K+-transporting ATPase ATPase A chain